MLPDLVVPYQKNRPHDGDEHQGQRPVSRSDFEKALQVE